MMALRVLVRTGWEAETGLLGSHMGIEVIRLDDGAGVEIRAEGVVHGADIIAAHGQIYDQRYLARQRYQIVDKTRCTEYDVTAYDIEQIAQLDRDASEINPHIKIAVIESRSLQFSLTELWQAHLASCPFVTKAFQDREAALAWLAEEEA